MCGIFCCLSKNCDNEIRTKTLNILKPNLTNRGPDFCKAQHFNFCEYYFTFYTSILWLQGPNLQQQPLETEFAVFAYNGDIFSGTRIKDQDILQRGDTKLLFDLLRISENFMDTLSHVHGPYSFLYLDKTTSRLYFSRDIYGRRSLLFGIENDLYTISSVSTSNYKGKCTEIPAIGVFYFDLITNNFNLIPWKVRNQNFESKLNHFQQFLDKPISIHVVECNPFGRNFASPTKSDLILLDNLKQFEGNSDLIFDFLSKSHDWKFKVDKVRDLLDIAVKKRIYTQPKFCQDCIQNRNKCDHALTSVLFSGGLDCSVLAVLADKYCDRDRPIDLLNVSFENKDGFDSPDRITSLNTLKELEAVCPERLWNFVDINITKSELDFERDNHIKDLIYPLNTILDDSLGCALWFASRGRNQLYKSPSRTVLVGMGADELFGGYTRHRAAFKKSSWSGLHQVLLEDWQNISHRNLGRDDRVVSDCARQLRTPYLDEDVVNYVLHLNPWEKTYPTSELPQGIGEKLLLRSLAFELGLKSAATNKKRAIQFGSRIANKNEKAHDTSPRLTK